MYKKNWDDDRSREQGENIISTEEPCAPLVRVVRVKSKSAQKYCDGYVGIPEGRWKDKTLQIKGDYRTSLSVLWYYLYL